ncbi:DUF1684 domain-containing protein [Spongiimicrobium salis]|uniref:DUF1684 domain-containing protein n=1 Tax=Spongiimicrobium salis TaxID=1667022 RepID=UPI00374D5958
MGKIKPDLNVFQFGKTTLKIRKIYILIFYSAAFLIMACGEQRKYHDTAEEAIEESPISAINDILKFQRDLNKTFKDPKTSPLPDRYRKNFEGLDFFAPDTNYVVTATLVRTPNAIPFMMPTTTNDQSREVVYGVAHFELKGKAYQLEIYQSPEQSKEEGYENYLFLPFLDQTNDNQTYAGGRYIDLEIPKGAHIQIDFNKAYNPYCAYNKKYSCPIVPKVNDLKTEIKAGVKDFNKK